MQGVRCCEEDRFYLRIDDGVGKLGAELEPVCLGEIGELLRLFADAANKAQPLALALRRFDDAFAPAPKSHDGCIDHGCAP
jgi:hypothetical protein